MVEVGKIKREFPKAEKHYDFNKYVAAFSIATLMFILGLTFGIYLMNEKVSAINEMQDSLKLEVMSIELQNILFQDNPCSDSVIPLEEKLEDITSRITFMENSLGKENKQVLEIKKYYSLIEVNHYLLMKNRKEKCGSDYNLVLFFYSNKDNELESEKQGYVLSNLKTKYTSDKIKIYSFDTGLDLDMIRTLIYFYNVTTAPTVIINEEKIEGFQDKEEVEKLIA